MKKRNAQPEQQLQITCVQWLELQRRMKTLTYFAVPNGGKRSKLAGWILKKMGMRPGIPDMVVGWSPAKLIFLELKAIRGYASTEQKDIHEELTRYGFKVFIIKSLEQMIQVITEQKGISIP